MVEGGSRRGRNKEFSRMDQVTFDIQEQMGSRKDIKVYIKERLETINTRFSQE
jgi:hypothetical protein